MADHEPTIHDDVDQLSEALDADKLPEEFPDRPLASREYGTTESEQARREPLDGRLRREVPDVTADEDDARPGRGRDDRAEDGDGPELLSQVDESGRDVVSEMVAESGRREGSDDDSGQPRSPRSAEEDAIRVVDEDGPLDDD
jgi:[ribosomal protein S5]-alanine N-acetyltransferase